MSMSLETTNYKIPYWDGKDIPQLAVDVPAMANKIDSVIKQNLPDVTDIENQLKNLSDSKADKTTTNTISAEIANLENYYNFTKNTGEVTPTQTSKSGQYDSVTFDMGYAMNSDYSYGKIYGYISLAIASTNTANHLYIPTSLKVKNVTGSEYLINPGGFGIKISSTGTVQSNVTTPKIQISATGVVTIVINNVSDIPGGNIRGSIPACLFSFVNFGDKI